MKRQMASAHSNGRSSDSHPFPRGTLFISIALLVGGMSLADVLPLPHMSRRAPLLPAPIANRPPSRDLSDAPILKFGPEIPGPAIYGSVEAKDVALNQIGDPLRVVSRQLKLVADGRSISLIDARNAATIWTGPVEKAHFVYTNTAAAQTVKDSAGRVLWKDERAPDLVFEKKSDGTACLSDGNGETLWSGRWPTSLPRSGARSEIQGSNRTVFFGGARIQGQDGRYTLRVDTGDKTETLWSGTLPAEPELLFRENYRYFFCGKDRTESGFDRKATIRIADQTGRVTISDGVSVNGLMEERLVRMLKVESVVEMAGNSRGRPVEHQFLVPSGKLSRSGSVFFTYRDESGQVVHKSNVVREGGRQYINTIGLPY